MKNNLSTLSKTFKTTASFMVLGLLNSSYVMSESIKPEDVLTPDCGGENVISYEFNDIPLSSMMMLVADSQKVEVTGMHLLGDKKVSSAATCVDAIEFAVALMLVHGFDLNSNENGWIITKS